MGTYKWLKVLYAGILTLSLLLWSGMLIADAATCGYPNGPKSGTMIADVNEWKTCSTMAGLAPGGEFWMTLSNMSAGSQLTNGIYGSYCVDLTGTILDNPQEGNVVYTVDFWSSLDPHLPSAVKQVQHGTATYTIPWDKINYLLNHYPNESWLNLQAAYWDLVHGCTQLAGSLYTCGDLRPSPYYFPYGPSAPYGCASMSLVNEIQVQVMVNDANANGSGFTPKAGDRIASVGQVTNCTPSTVCNQYLPYQVFFIPTTCPTCTGSIGDYVWKDLNGNGKQDDGEPGIPGVEVKLTGTDSYGQTVNLTTTTDKDGQYQFSQLCTGDYRVSVTAATVPSGVTATINRSANGNDNSPLDSNEPTGTSVSITTDSSSNLTVDFGYVPACLGAVGDYVWLDGNANGTQDGIEPGIPNVKVLLNGSNIYGHPVNMTSTTDSAGIYGFSGLCQGNYTVTVDAGTVPASYAPTSPLSGNGSDLLPNDSNNPFGTSLYLANDGDSNYTLDFGYVPACSGTIGDFVWKDLNENGVQDSGEPGMENVVVSLSGTNGYGQLVSMNATTDSTGKYIFSGLCKGIYTITVNPATVSSGWVSTAPLKADGNATIPNDVVDSNAPGGTIVALTGDSSSNPTVDFGYVPNCTGTIGDFVWEDKNGNGLQDDGAASGIDGVQVLLTGTNIYGQPVNLSDTTKNNGYYQFAELCQGRYTVAVNAATTGPLGLVFTQPRSANGDDLIGNDSNEPIGTTVELMGNSGSNQNVDFGYIRLAALGDRVWLDLDHNGVQDGGEAGIPDVIVRLFDCSGNDLNISAIIDGSGFYHFTGLVPGSYRVKFAAPNGYLFSTPFQGGNLTTDSNADITGLSDCTTLISGEANNSVDAGLYLNSITGTCVSITAVQGIAITPVTMTASGGTGAPYSFSATGLPAGITMAADGTISGAPSVSGTFNYTVTVKDKDNNSGTFNCSVTVNASIAANCVSITAVQGFAITPVTMTASGGTGGPYSFSATGLPTGITMAADGTISGTPSVSGTFDYIVTIKDKDGNIGTFNCSITVNPPVIATCVSINVVQGIAITPVIMTASGGTGGPYSFSATGLPAGITMAANGTISGTATISGAFSYTVTVKDKDGNTGTFNCSVTVNPPPAASCVAITAVQGVAITPVKLIASGGTGTPYTFTATGLPTGITMAADGTISGTPTVSGTFNYTVMIKDKDGNTGTSNCSVVVNSPPSANCVTITAVQGVAITPVKLIATGGVGGPYSFSVTGLPTGITMAADGTISGTPTVSGTFNYTVTVQDKDGNTGTFSCSVTVNSPPTASCVSITAVQGFAITPVTMIASGGTGGTYTFSATGLPAGITMAADGTISGTPTVSGTFNYTVMVKDKDGNTGTSNCSVVVNAPPTANCVSITAVQGVAITPVKLTATSGTGAPYSFSATGLPAGITMAVDGTISGTPIVSGTFNYTVMVKDKDGNTGISNCSVVVNAPPTANCVSITAVQGVAITPVKLTASGGAGAPYSFSATGLPAGITMAADGTISGPPTVSGTFNYTVTVKDKNGNSGTSNCSVVVNPPPTASCVSITAMQGVAITPVVMTASGGAGGPYVFTATGLPAGITMALDGTISGNPTLSGTFTYIVTVTDKNGNGSVSNCTIIVKIPSFGCTFTIGYWKNHAGFGPQADVLTPLLPQYLGNKGGTKTMNVTTAKIAYDILGQNVYGTSSNGITKLYAQLLAAKLNIKAGADPAALASTIVAADNFLATTNYSAWANMKQGDQSKVLSWVSSLDAYNNGVSGPGHCGSQESVACINLQKKISVDSGKTWLDADTQESAAAKSAPFNVLYKLIVNNCGTVGLVNVDVDDSLLGISNYLISTLPAGASAALNSSQISKLAPTTKACQSSGAFENVATATAVYNGIPVTASDSAWLVCRVATSCLDITKDISVDGGLSWKTADTQATAPTTTAPHSADYRLTVKNCGSTTLNNVQVEDSYLGIPTYSVGSLSSGASKAYTYKQIPQLRDMDACTTAGIFSNTAIVSGSNNGVMVSDSDTAWLVCTGSTSGGCSYTWGYWKTHTVYDGTKKRNSTWDKVAGGENALFFGLGQSWYNVLMTDPSGGNAYYILAHQYIAAYLNKLSGANVSVIDGDLKHAADLLGKYDGIPFKATDIAGTLRDDFIATASRLDQYNNGLIGPGHCK